MKKDNWIYKVFLCTFILAMIFSAVTSGISAKINEYYLIIIILVVIFIGILFDMIGVAVLSASVPSFHAKNSRKIKGAREAIILINNSAKVASFCNDIIGDICGIISGSLGAVLSIFISTKLNISLIISTILISALISAFTVGGKAIGKNIAIKRSDDIVFKVGLLKNALRIKNKVDK